MLKEAVRAVDAGILPQIGLIAFLIGFFLVIVFAITMPKRRREEAKRLPLDRD